MVAIFSYGFQVADDNFANANVKLTTLSNYENLIKFAQEKEYITAKQAETLQDWSNPEDYLSDKRFEKRYSETKIILDELKSQNLYDPQLIEKIKDEDILLKIKYKTYKTYNFDRNFLGRQPKNTRSFILFGRVYVYQSFLWNYIKLYYY